jgi:hypothetical protein
MVFKPWESGEFGFADERKKMWAKSISNTSPFHSLSPYVETKNKEFVL